jgi:hypothetical protein
MDTINDNINDKLMDAINDDINDDIITYLSYRTIHFSTHSVAQYQIIFLHYYYSIFLITVCNGDIE